MLNNSKYSRHSLLSAVTKAIFALLIYGSVCGALYEDQVGKFDWKQQYVGKVLFAHVDPTTAGTQKFVVATEQNVLASINSRTGAVTWRQVFEKGEKGEINALSSEGELITISGNGQFVRSWDSNGLLQWETTLPNLPISADDHVRKFFINSGKKEIIMIKLYPNSHVTIVIHNLTGAQMKTSDIIAAPWCHSKSSCEFLSSNYFVCADEKSHSLELLSVNDGGAFMNIPLKNFGIKTSQVTADIAVVSLPYQASSQEPFFAVQLGSDGHIVFQLQSSGIKLIKVLPGVVRMTSTIIDNKHVIFSAIPADNEYKIVGVESHSWTEFDDLEGSFELPSNHGEMEIFFVLPYAKRDKGVSYKLLVSTQDHALLMIHQFGKLVWSREEALASIVSAEVLDLPLSETDAKIEQEFGMSDANLTSMLLTRLTTQALQLQTFLLQTLLGLQSNSETGGEGTTLDLTRDTFGLHKVIVVVTTPGKIFGLDSLTGQIVWSHLVDNLIPYRHLGSFHLPLFVQRTTAHFPYPPQCTVLGKQKTTGKGYLFSFNPINGRPLHTRILSFYVLQASMIGFVDDLHLRGIVILDSDLKIHVFPEAAMKLLEMYNDVHYMFVADISASTVTGYSLAFSTSKQPQVVEVWKVTLPQQIVQVSTKRPTEHVHSQGRVMGDRSVLYKYLNPNLAVIITEGSDPTQKSFINVYLLDTVTGMVIYSASHKKAKGPVHIVHSENWAVYSYYSEKSRRLEMSSIELYEGKSQSNTTAFSSLAPPPLPLVEHQTFIFPSSVETMTDTVTERGMTSKHLLISLPSGGILELPKAFLDPRRPIHPTPEHREEGLIPYIPELPLSAESIINYNQSVLRARGIQTAPSGLESTCLVFVYGLDIFYTRVTPSKTFDILKDDFDHLLISAVLLGLLFLSYISKKLAARKALRAAWK